MVIGMYRESELVRSLVAAWRKRHSQIVEAYAVVQNIDHEWEPTVAELGVILGEDLSMFRGRYKCDECGASGLTEAYSAEFPGQDFKYCYCESCLKKLESKGATNE